MTMRDLPSVDRLLAMADDLVAEYGRPLTLEVLREVLNEKRTNLRATAAPAPELEVLLAQTRQRLATIVSPTLHPVINATGVLIHTNLGRAPLSRAALAQVTLVAQTYSSLEYEVGKGERGSRTQHAEALLTRLTGAEAALVVNNNAAALLLCLAALAKGKNVPIARSQLVEIGGGFRVPDVMKQSGAKLLEVGATNRSYLRDFEDVVDDKVALILHAHQSNFKLVGFTTEPSLAELCALGVPVLADLGSGALLDTAQFGLAHEPTVQEAVKAGAALVAFSGDKLLGGPQAGIIVGRKDLVDKLKKHPLARAMRADKLCLAALNATLLHYLKDEALREIPLWRMLSEPAEEIGWRAESWVAVLGLGQVLPSVSTIGGGSLPGETLPTHVVALSVPAPNALAARLRAQNPPIIARVADDLVLLDPRTVQESEEHALITGVSTALYELKS